MKYSQIKEMTGEELSRKLEELKEGYLKLRFRHATGQLDSSAKLKAARRDVARTLTAQNARRAPAGGAAKE